MKKEMSVFATSLLLGTLAFAAQRPSVGVHAALPLGDLDDGTAYGAQTQIGISERMSVELAITTGQSKDDINLEPTLGAPGSMDIESTTFASSLIFRQPLCEKMALFVLGGISYCTTDADGKTTSDAGSPEYIVPTVDDQVGFHVGGGIDVDLSEHIRLFAEYRHTFSDLDATLRYKPSNLDETSREFSDSLDYGLVKLGVGISF